ncbi:hypothetical protein ACEQ8H_003234 [Pleosporales sp. CAS-2024a]
MDYAKSPDQVHDWQNDPYWRTRRLSPAQIQVHDIRLQGTRRQHVGPMLEMREILSSSLLPALERRDDLARALSTEETTSHEHAQVKALATEFGWLNVLRSSKFSDYLAGCLVGLADWRTPDRAVTALQQLNHCISQQERFSKHGRYFAPFLENLTDGASWPEQSEDGPMLLSVPFLDWGLDGKTPPLRFQIDPREGYQSARSSSHLLRSILQHFYRLEDTEDRESQQVFTKHKPWQTDRNLDLKVQRFYGHYPTSLTVDELWILVIDSRHVVTFSSNQSWKSRWPPLQVAARIAEVSFRGIRNSLLNTSPRQTELGHSQQDYTSSLHIVAALSGALGMLHRSFWTDIPLCLSDRYAGYLSHLQFRLLRAPTSKLVMDLLQVQEELNIVISIMEQQMELVSDLQGHTFSRRHSSRSFQSHRTRLERTPLSLPPAEVATYRQVSFSRLSDPAANLFENLQREYADLVDLRENSNALINRTIQLVNIRLEDHGKAILVFTIITLVFLPLNFIAAFFGMNFADIRDMGSTSRLFWTIAASFTVAIMVFSLFLAFYGGSLMERFVTWREQRQRRLKMKRTEKKRKMEIQQVRQSRMANFEVLDALRPEVTGPF